MKKFRDIATAQSVWTMAKPWLITGLIIVALRISGGMSYITYAAGAAVMMTGAIDAVPEEPTIKNKDFDYDFAVQDLQGNTVDFKTFKNKTVFINLWATWCGPCRVEMPSIQKLYGSVDHDKIAFVMLALDKPGNKEKVVQYIQDKGHTFPVYTPLNGLPAQLQVPSIPTTFVISPQGKIVSKKVGTANYDSDDFREFLLRQ
jgi:thiol-disulfide isomerase/thioredoxin